VDYLPPHSAVYKVRRGSHDFDELENCGLLE